MNLPLPRFLSAPTLNKFRARPLLYVSYDEPGRDSIPLTPLSDPRPSPSDAIGWFSEGNVAGGMFLEDPEMDALKPLNGDVLGLRAGGKFPDGMVRPLRSDIVGGGGSVSVPVGVRNIGCSLDEPS
jgi:hypothetical protein